MKDSHIITLCSIGGLVAVGVATMFIVKSQTPASRIEGVADPSVNTTANVTNAESGRPVETKRSPVAKCPEELANLSSLLDRLQSDLEVGLNFPAYSDKVRDINYEIKNIRKIEPEKLHGKNAILVNCLFAAAECHLLAQSYWAESIKTRDELAEVKANHNRDMAWIYASSAHQMGRFVTSSDEFIDGTECPICGGVGKLKIDISCGGCEGTGKLFERAAN